MVDYVSTLKGNTQLDKDSMCIIDQFLKPHPSSKEILSFRKATVLADTNAGFNRKDWRIRFTSGYKASSLIERVMDVEFTEGKRSVYCLNHSTEDGNFLYKKSFHYQDCVECNTWHHRDAYECKD